MAQAGDATPLAGGRLAVRGTITAADLEALADGLSSLPPRLRDFPGGPLEVDVAAAPCPRGLVEPEWLEGRFQLCAFAPVESWREEALTLDERRQLWRRRAVVHAVITRWDEARGWSATASWRSINGWTDDGPANLSPFAMARTRGAASARLDLATFAETFFVPVEAVHPGALAADDAEACRDFTRARILHTLVAPLGVPPAPRPDCPAFERWARRSQLERLEVLLVDASGRSPESLFGHVVLRPVWRDLGGATFDTVMQVAAITPPRGALGLSHLWRGLTGGYGLGFFSLSWADVRREALSDEQRSIRRFAVRLSPPELGFAMERLWEVERRARLDYRFLTFNCASAVSWALAPVVSAPLGSPALDAPAAVLDHLAAARAWDGGPLLSAIAPALESTTRRAERNDDARARLEAELPAPDALWSRARSTSVGEREAAWARLLATTRASDARLRRRWMSWWAATVRIERAAADSAARDLAALELSQTSDAGAPMSPELQWRERDQVLERETVLASKVMVLDRATLELAERRMDRAASAPPSLLPRDEAERTLAAFDRLTADVAELSLDLDEPDLGRALEEEDARDLAGLAAAAPTPIDQSSHGHLSAVGGVDVDPAGRIGARVAVHAALVAQRLGDWRARGYGPRTGVEVLGVELAAAPAMEQLREAHLTYLSFETLQGASLPASALARHLGFDARLASDWQPLRGSAWRHGLEGHLLAFAIGDGGRSHLALGVGPAAFVGVGAEGVRGLGGASGRLTARLALPGAWPHGLRLEARAQSLWGGPRVEQSVRGEVMAEWVIAWGGRARWVVSPRLSAERRLDGGYGQVAAGVGLEWVGGVPAR